MFNRGVLEQIYLLHSSLISLGLTYSSLILSCLNTPFWARQPDVGPALTDGPSLLIRGWFLVTYHRNHRSSADTLLWHSVIQTGRFGSLREIDGKSPILDSSLKTTHSSCISSFSADWMQRQWWWLIAK